MHTVTHSPYTRYKYTELPLCPPIYKRAPKYTQPLIKVGHPLLKWIPVIWDEKVISPSTPLCSSLFLKVINTGRAVSWKVSFKLHPCTLQKVRRKDFWNYVTWCLNTALLRRSSSSGGVATWRSSDTNTQQNNKLTAAFADQTWLSKVRVCSEETNNLYS